MTCKTHSWGEWFGYDPYVFEMGMTDGFRYHRGCSIDGCPAEQRTEDLVMTGNSEIRIRKETHHDQG